MSDWTTDTLKEYAEARFVSQQEAVSMALDAAEKAVDKAERLADIRAATQNATLESLRQQMTVQMTRNEYESAHAILVDRMAAITQRMDRHEGQGQGASRSVGYLFLAIGSLTGIVGIVIALLAMFSR